MHLSLWFVLYYLENLLSFSSAVIIHNYPAMSITRLTRGIVSLRNNLPINSIQERMKSGRVNPLYVRCS